MGRLTWRCAVSTCTDQLGTLAGAFRASEPSQVRLSTRIGWHPCRSDTARPSRAGSLAVSTEPEAVSAPVPILGTGVGIASRVCKELKQRGAAMHAHHQPNESGRCGRDMEEGNMGAAGRWWWWRRRCWRGTDASPPPPPPFAHLSHAVYSRRPYQCNFCSGTHDSAASLDTSVACGSWIGVWQRHDGGAA